MQRNCAQGCAQNWQARRLPYIARIRLPHGMHFEPVNGR
jgi:hypothetical protein